ncbi:hypothetical protein NWF34_02000 [Gordonia sp. GONU]|uniref:hypothetical protein n=1 Tax=Gordonia sp. GONU TaxID=2972949 RepID=UPI0021AC220C|nr:hypothetical protein [Gordonia sp. GONU]MCR8895720.1 hypothetical protein [Gordonia sp. GONU]
MTASDAGMNIRGVDGQAEFESGVPIRLGAVTVHESRIPDVYVSDSSVPGFAVVVIGPPL